MGQGVHISRVRSPIEFSPSPVILSEHRERRIWSPGDEILRPLWGLRMTGEGRGWCERVWLFPIDPRSSAQIHGRQFRTSRFMHDTAAAALE